MAKFKKIPSVLFQLALTTVLGLSCQLLHANTLTRAQLTLHRIERLSSQEKHGDEIYISLTQYGSQSRPVLLRVPDHPAYWLVNHLPQIKDIPIWNFELQPQESVELVLSLVEHDMPPWNVDDHLGSIKIKIKDKQAVFESIEFKDGLKPDQASNHPLETFVFEGGKAKYKLAFSLSFS